MKQRPSRRDNPEPDSKHKLEVEDEVLVAVEDVYLIDGSGPEVQLQGDQGQEGQEGQEGQDAADCFHH